MKKILSVVLSFLGVSVLQASIPSGVVKLTTGVFANGGQIRDLKIDGNGKIVACGYTMVGGQKRWTVARLHPWGALDTSFNTVGYQQWAMDGSVANSLVIQTDNKIVVVGRGNDRAQLFRYNVDGSISASEGPIDLVNVAPSTAVGVTIDNTNTYILVTAVSLDTIPIQYAARRNISDITVSNLVSEDPNTITLPADVNQFVGGAVVRPTSNELIGFLYEVGTSNAAFYYFPSPYTARTSRSATPGLHVVVCQTDTIVLQSRWTDGIHFIKKTTNGSLTGGTDYTILPSTSTTFPFNVGGGLVLTADTLKVILCAGTTTSSATPQPFISRLVVSDGSFDNTFGSAGKTVQTESGLNPGYYAAVAMQSSGKAVVGGFTTQANVDGEWIIARYTDTGTLDTTFGFNPAGLFQDTTLPFNTTLNGLILTTTIDQSGKLVVGGYYGPNAMAVRYNTASSPVRDSTFDGDGALLLTSLATTSSLNKIVNAGTGYAAAGQSNNSFTTVKLTNAGALDPIYGGGTGITRETTLGAGTAVGILANEDGSFTASGQTTVNGTLLSTLIAYDNEGVKLPWFGAGGVQTFSNFGTGILNSLLAIANSKLVAAGQMGSVATLVGMGGSSALLNEILSGF